MSGPKITKKDVEAYIEEEVQKKGDDSTPATPLTAGSASKSSASLLNPANLIVSGGRKVGHFAVEGGRAVGHVAQNTGQVVTHAAAHPGDAIVSGGKAVGSGIKKTAVAGMSVGKSFKAFISRGNVIDLAVGIVMGAAFTAIVNSFVTDLITPIVGLATGSNLENLFIVIRTPANATNATYSTPAEAQKIGVVTWNYGRFIQTLLNFIIISACMFFLVRAVQTLLHKKEELPNETECLYCKSSIDKSATRCKFCTSQVIPEIIAEDEDDSMGEDKISDKKSVKSANPDDEYFSALSSDSPELSHTTQRRNRSRVNLSADERV